jgi:RimJ/RimL family protein N-acetyltransferase
MSFNVWQGEKVRLRAVEPEDWETYYRDSTDTEAARVGDQVHILRSAEVMRQWAQELSLRKPENDSYQWAIEALEGVLVGMISTFNSEVHNGTFEYGLGVHRAHWRRGYASEAIRLVLTHYFRELRYQKVTVRVYAFNEPSIRLHESLGFQQEGRLRRMIFTGGEYHDVLVFGLTAEEFSQQPM